MGLDPRVRVAGLIVCCIVFALLANACGGDSTGPAHEQAPAPPADTTTVQDTASHDTTSTETVTASAADVNAAATALYDHLAQGADVTDDVTAILNAFVPVLGAGDTTEMKARVAAREPVVLDVQAQLVAQSYHDNKVYDLDNFLTAMADGGVTAESPAGPLTRDYLTQTLAPLVSQQTYTAYDIVPAFVLALGRARAAHHAAGGTDPVWGDNRLDPLQAMLLLYAFDFSESSGGSGRTVAGSTPRLDVRDPGAMTHAGAPRIVARTPMADVSTGLPSFGASTPFGNNTLLGGATNPGDDEGNPSTLGICDEILIDGYQFDLIASPLDVWHKDAAHPEHVDHTDVTAFVSFNFTPTQEQEIYLGFNQCTIPPSGPLFDKDVLFTADDPLPAHGQLSQPLKPTDGSGEATVTFQTIGETVPKGLELQEAPAESGTVTASITTVNPRFPTLAILSGQGVYDNVITTVLLTVHHYEFPDTLLMHIETSISGSTDDLVWDGSAHADLTLTLIPPEHRSVMLYQGDGPAVFDSYSETVPGAACAYSVTTTSGRLRGYILPDTDAAVPLASVAGDPNTDDVPFETINCAPAPPVKVPFSQLWLDWLLLHAPVPPSTMPLKGWTIVSPGVLQLQFDGTPALPETDPPITVTEQTTVTLRVPHP
jgi:hypothetical protein